MSGPFDTPDLPPAVQLHRGGLPGRMPYDLVVLPHDARLVRRQRLVTVHDEGFFVDLAGPAPLHHRDVFELADGRLIEVIAADEPLVEITGPALPRIAWHLGGRHVPCQIETTRILARRDPALEALLAQLGAQLTAVSEPFEPEDGPLYDHGPRTHAMPGRPAGAGTVEHHLPPGGPFDPD